MNLVCYVEFNNLPSQLIYFLLILPTCFVYRNSSTGKIVSIDGQTNLADTDFKKTLKLTWLAVADSLVPVQILYYDHIISKPVLGKDEDFKQFVNYNSKKIVDYVGEAELKDLKVNDIIQLQRIGYFRCDSSYAPNK